MPADLPRLDDPQTDDTHWTNFCNLIRRQVSDSNWQTWLAPLHHRSDHQQLELLAPSDFHLHMVVNKFDNLLQDTTQTIYGKTFQLQYSVSNQGSPSDSTSIHQPRDEHNLPHSDTATVTTLDDQTRTGKRYRFEDFVVGKSNQFAFAAAQAVAEQPNHSRYNPLFLYAEAGLGKTHLLKSVGNYVREHHPDMKVSYVTSEEFFSEFIEAIRRKTTTDFKQRYRSTDVLLLDDIQFLDGKGHILEEFFHTFNKLYESGRQMVISSDRHPRNLSTTVEDRLRSRFSWGVMTDIQPPDIETRIAILRQNAEASGVRVSREVMDYIAGLITSNIRELEGALIRITAYSQLTSQPIKLDLAREVLHDIHPGHDQQQITAEQILLLTARSAELTSQDLTGPSRKQPIASTRQIAMYLCRELTEMSLPQIGGVFGGRDHSTVLHACNKISDAMRTDREVFDRVTELTQLLRSRSKGESYPTIG